MKKYVLRLHIAGQGAKSERVIANVRRICENELQGQYELSIIDVLEKSDLAEDRSILAAPTLIKESPPPFRCLVGDLFDTKKVLLALEVPESR